MTFIVKKPNMGKNPLNQLYYYYYKGLMLLSRIKFRIFSRDEYTANNTAFKTSLDQYLDLNNYVNLFNGTARLNAVPTNQYVEPKTLSVDAKGIKKEYGTPDFIFNNNKLKIFVYKRKLYELRIRLQIHLYKGSVFLFQATYSKIDNDDKRKLLDSVLKRYVYAEFDIMTSKIIDKNNNVSFMSSSSDSLQITNFSSKESGWFTDMEKEIDVKRKSTRKIISPGFMEASLD
jgi:hypothetical protein